MQVYITKTNIENTISILEKKFSSLEDKGCFFALITNEYDDNGNIVYDFFDVIEKGLSCGYKYINTIVYPSLLNCESHIQDNVKYIVWLCKNPKEMLFNKDFIREKHIWKDVEWGKRAKNYNPKGKDPGNVWIPTIDDGKANITEHILLSDEDVIKKLLTMTCCGDNYQIFDDSYSNEKCNKYSLPSFTREISSAITSPRVVFGTSEMMKSISSNSVSLVVTSPPYWNLKDYFKEGQIGQESYDTYIDRMKMVWKQCFDKLTSNGTMWVNINTRVHEGKTVLIPKDFIKVCKEIGFYYKGVVIWHKSSGIPTHDKNIVDRHEYVLVFSKSNELQIDISKLNSFSDYKNNYINGKAFWNINRKAGSVGKNFIHPAIYPNGLVERIVLCSTVEGDLVLDPFLGSGTSLIAAANLSRNFIGYEFNEGFKELMESRYEKELNKDINVIYQYDS